MEKSEPQNSSFQQEKDVVPIGSYLFALFAWWRESVLGMILAGVGGAGLLLTAELILPRYESFCDVAIIPTEADVSIDNTLRMATTASVRARHLEVESRREGLLGLVHNGTVAQAVIERLGNRWDEKKPRAAELLEQIHSRMVVSIKTHNQRNISDLIRITARADRAEKAAALADAWAEEYVKHVNLLYQQVPENVLRGVASELTEAQEAYAVTQRKLETFIASNTTPRIQRLVAEKKALIESMNETYLTLVRSRFSGILGELQSITNFEEVLSKGRDSLLRDTYERVRTLTELKKKAMGLRLQIDKGGQHVGSNYLPLLLLKADAFSSLSDLSDVLDINLDGTHSIHATPAEQRVDLDAFIETLDELQKNQTSDLERLTLATSPRVLKKDKRDDFLSNGPDEFEISTLFKYSNPKTVQDNGTDSLIPESAIDYAYKENPHVEKLEKEIQLLTAEIEKNDAMLKYITQERDIRRSALESLQNESVELQLTRASASGQVRLAAHSVLAIDTTYPSPLLIAFLSGLAGLLAMAGFALATNGVGMRPPLGRRGSPRSKKRGDDC